jgi:hypothetical protein
MSGRAQPANPSCSRLAAAGFDSLRVRLSFVSVSI